MLRRSFLPILLAMAATASAVAGDLNPPAGPITATGSFGPRIVVNAINTPGDIDSLFRISQPGSYYLGGNITGVADKDGIAIAASGVTLDLMGFELSGVPGSFSGISVTVSATNVQIQNGSTRDWDFNGVGAGSASNSSLRNLFSEGNAGSGLVIGADGLVEGCSAKSNGGNGIVGLRGVVFIGNTASFNTFAGISASDGSTVSACTARSNGTAGFLVTGGCTVMGCSARANTSAGIIAGAASTVVGNSMQFNPGVGIKVSVDCLVLNNTCDSNDAGIHVTGSDNRIDGNNVTDNVRGIDIDVSGNLVIRNSASGNTTNYDILGTQTIGPIIASTGTITSTNPWANFSY